MKDETRLAIDALIKHIVLLAVTYYCGLIVWQAVKYGRKIDLPDFLVSIFTMVIIYYFRKPPKKQGGE